jgi:hypothetical protein
MPQHRREHPIRIVRINRDAADLLPVAQTQMPPGLAGVGRFVNPVAGRKVRPLQPFSATYINDVGIGRRHRDYANRPGRLIVKNRLPGLPEIGRFPNAAVIDAHVKHVGLARYADYRRSAPSAKRPDHPPLHFREKCLGERLSANDGQSKKEQRESAHRPILSFQCGFARLHFSFALTSLML